MELIEFAGYAPPGVTQYQVVVSDADASGAGRSEDGVMNRERVRGGDNPIYAITVGWDNISDSEVQAIREAIKPESLITRFWFGEMISAEMYAGNQTLELITCADGECRWKLSFTMTQF